jgi:hypothetical protein
LSATGEALALWTCRTEFLLGQFAVAVLIELLERLGCFREFIGIDGAIFVGIECVHDRAHRTESLSAGAARKPLSRPAFSARLSFAAGAKITLRAIATGLVSPRLVSPRLVTARLVTARLVSPRLVTARLVTARLVTAWTFATRLFALRTLAARPVSLRAFACGTVASRRARRRCVLGDGDV